MVYDALNFASAPRYKAGIGLASDMGILIPNGRVVAFVRSGGVSDGMHQDVRDLLHTTLNRGLAQARLSGDTVVVLPDHAENISAADQMTNLSAGNRILGMGDGTNRPTFTWTAATSTFLFDVANVTLDNCILEMAPTSNGGVTVAAPITVSAAGCAITNCQIQFGGDSNDIVTNGITTTAAADDFNFSHNFCYGATTAEAVSFLKIVGADRLVMVGNYIAGATTTTSGGVLLFATTESLDIYLKDNIYINRKGSSTCAVVGLAAVSGVSHQEHFGYLDTSSKTAWLTSTGIMVFHRPTVTNTAGNTGTEVVGTVST